jgi:hypothetical protein
MKRATDVAVDWAAKTRTNRMLIKKGELKIGDRDVHGQRYEEWSADLLEYFRHYRWPQEKARQDTYKVRTSKKPRVRVRTGFEKKQKQYKPNKSRPTVSNEQKEQQIKKDSHKTVANVSLLDQFPVVAWLPEPVEVLQAIVLKDSQVQTENMVGDLQVPVKASVPAPVQASVPVCAPVCVDTDFEIWNLLHSIDDGLNPVMMEGMEGIGGMEQQGKNQIDPSQEEEWIHWINGIHGMDGMDQEHLEGSNG